MAIGNILKLVCKTTPFYDVLTLVSMTEDQQFNYDPAVFTVPVTKFMQPLPASGQTGFISTPSTASFGGEPHTQGSPNVTQEFVLEILYPAGQGPALGSSLESYRQLAIAAVNPAFGLNLA